MSKIHSSLQLKPGDPVCMSEDVNDEVGLSWSLPERTHWSFMLYKDSKKTSSSCFLTKCQGGGKSIQISASSSSAKDPCSCCRYVSSRRINTVMWLSWGESCLGGVWQRDSSLPRVVWLEEIPARSFLFDPRKGGQSQLNTSVGGFTTLHWCWSKHRWRIRRIDVSLLVSLLGQRSVLCSSEWPYLKLNRAYY